MLGDTHLGLEQALTDISPFRAHVTGSALVVLMITRCTSTTAIRDLWGKETRFITHKLPYYHKDMWYAGTTHTHREMERGRKR